MDLGSVYYMTDFQVGDTVRLEGVVTGLGMGHVYVDHVYHNDRNFKLVHRPENKTDEPPVGTLLPRHKGLTGMAKWGYFLRASHADWLVLYSDGDSFRSSYAGMLEGVTGFKEAVQKYWKDQEGS